mmetsp:Transcript_15449/g.17680  ORF Transcript_15449/g.17680 Transcript_15449/m.17680 type:complete len:82 (-) Transcript_15449:446-691(-)
MKVISNSNIAVLLLTVPLLLTQQSVQVNASASCPSGKGSLPFTQSCQNACPDGELVVGPGILTSGGASKYNVAGFYFGHQN